MHYSYDSPKVKPLEPAIFCTNMTYDPCPPPTEADAPVIVTAPRDAAADQEGAPRGGGRPSGS